MAFFSRAKTSIGSRFFSRAPICTTHTHTTDSQRGKELDIFCWIINYVCRNPPSNITGKSTRLLYPTFQRFFHLVLIKIFMQGNRLCRIWQEARNSTTPTFLPNLCALQHERTHHTQTEAIFCI